MKVCFFLDNPYSMDTRIIKECESLYELGCDVSVICYWRKGFPEGLTIENGIKVYRLKRGFKNIAQNINLVKRHVSPEYKHKLSKSYGFFNQVSSKIKFIKKCIFYIKKTISNFKVFSFHVLGNVSKKISAFFSAVAAFAAGLIYYFFKAISPSSFYRAFRRLIPISWYRSVKHSMNRASFKLSKQAIENKSQKFNNRHTFVRGSVYKLLLYVYKVIAKMAFYVRIIYNRVVSFARKLKNKLSVYHRKAKNTLKSFLRKIKNGIKLFIRIVKYAIHISKKLIVLSLVMIFNLFYIAFAFIKIMYYELFKISFHQKNNGLHGVKKSAVKLQLIDKMMLIIQIITVCFGLIIFPIIYIANHLENRSFILFRTKITPKNNFMAFIKGLKYITFSPTFISNFIVGVLLKPDVVQANDPPTILSAFLSGKFIKSQLIYDAHEIYDESFPTRKPLLLRFIIRCLEKTMTHHAFQNFTVNSSIADLMQARYKIPTTPKVLRNVQLKNDLYSTDNVSNTDLEFFKGYDNKIKLLYAGKLTYGRGIEAVIKAMPHVNEDYHLFLMGHCDKQFRHKIDKLIAHYNVENMITIMPSVPSDQVVDVCRQADIGLMLTTNMTLSYYYGLGNKIFHYIGSGIPVLVPNQPEKAQLIKNHDVGWVVPKLHQTAITDVLQKIAEDKSMINKKKENCIEASMGLIWEKEVQNYLNSYINIYENILFEDNVYA